MTRERLPANREGWTHKAVICGAPVVCPHCKEAMGDGKIKLFVTCNYFPGTNRPAELFVTCDQAGSLLDGFADMFATGLSLLWQFGMTFEETFRKFAFVEFEPKGLTREEDVKAARSIVDYLMQLVKVETERRGAGKRGKRGAGSGEERGAGSGERGREGRGEERGEGRGERGREGRGK